MPEPTSRVFNSSADLSGSIQFTGVRLDERNRVVADITSYSSDTDGRVLTRHSSLDRSQMAALSSEALQLTHTPHYASNLRQLAMANKGMETLENTGRQQLEQLVRNGGSAGMTGPHYDPATAFF